MNTAVQIGMVKKCSICGRHYGGKRVYVPLHHIAIRAGVKCMVTHGYCSDTCMAEFYGNKFVKRLQRARGGA
jgi:hypothetical protein